VGFPFIRRQPHVPTLHDELRKLEERARAARAATGAGFSRSMLARESGVAESTLASWIDRGRIPQESGKLLEVVRVLSGWAGVATADVPWQDLWVTARAGASSRKGGYADDGAAKKKKDWGLRGLVFVGTTAVAALITGLFTPFGGDIHNRLPVVGAQASTPASQSVSQSGPSGGPASASGGGPAEDFQVTAYWCCKLVSVEAKTGFYWPGSAGSLSAALDPVQTGAVPPVLMPAGLGLVEIPVQTSGTEPILVAPPQVIIRSRGPNLTTGMIAILPRGGQGGGSPGEYETDVDNAVPVTVPAGAAAGRAAYQYVSANSTEVITLFVADANYDCTFDIQLTWQEQGHLRHTPLTNGGKHFRMIGSAGLPWYAGDPHLRTPLARVSAGKPFSHYTSLSRTAD
jgi:hypothetical protein